MAYTLQAWYENAAPNIEQTFKYRYFALKAAKIALGKNMTVRIIKHV